MSAANVEVAQGEGRDAEGETFVEEDVEPAEGVERRRHHGDDESDPAAYDVHVDEGIRIARSAVEGRADLRADEDEDGVRDGIDEPEGGVLRAQSAVGEEEDPIRDGEEGDDAVHHVVCGADERGTGGVSAAHVEILPREHRPIDHEGDGDEEGERELQGYAEMCDLAAHSPLFQLHRRHHDEDDERRGGEDVGLHGEIGEHQARVRHGEHDRDAEHPQHRTHRSQHERRYPVCAQSHSLSLNMCGLTPHLCKIVARTRFPRAAPALPLYPHAPSFASTACHAGAE